MRSNTRSSLLLSLLAAAVLSACSSTPTGPEQSGASVEDRNAVKSVDLTGNGVNAGGLDAATLAMLRDPKNILSKREIFFDFDSFVIKNEFKPLIEAHAKFLVSRPQAKMLIQGNADERGSREYNLALGQKRADAIKKALLLLGAQESQIESVSLGEEKPKNAGHDEAAYAENRRGDILYQGEF